MKRMMEDEEKKMPKRGKKMMKRKMKGRGKSCR